MRIAALALLMGSTLIAIGGCGGASEKSTPAELRLQREDLVAVARVLRTVEGPVAKEVTATKTAWPLVANGLPAQRTSIARAPIAAAAESAAKITLPGLFGEAEAASLTGPASQLAGLFRTFSLLAARGWRLIGSATEQIEHGSPVAARFERENVALYIDSVYDSHFSLAQIGKLLLAGYLKLGGPTAFGSAFTQREVDALADTYSEATDRLHPHAGVHLGS